MYFGLKLTNIRDPPLSTGFIVAVFLSTVVRGLPAARLTIDRSGEHLTVKTFRACGNTEEVLFVV
jgi:hypothetical protein